MKKININQLSFPRFLSFPRRRESTLIQVLKRLFAALGLMAFPLLAHAENAQSHLDPIAIVVFWTTLLFFFGLVGRAIAEKLQQPGVLGELLMGVLVGNVCYFLQVPFAIILREGTAIFAMMREVLSGMPLSQAIQTSITNPVYASQVLKALSGPNAMDLIKVAYIVDIFSRYGVIFLLFMAGLESTVEEIKHSGKEALAVAVIGVIAPILLGLGVTYWCMEDWSFKSALFVAATLSATSVGITARVLKELKKLQTREARTILGAAMIDDILGLIILAIVSSLVINGIVQFSLVLQIIILACTFFIAALLIGPLMLKAGARFFVFLEPWEAKLVISFLFVMFWSWLATQVQLAAIIGAFAAGIIIHECYFEAHDQKARKFFNIKELVAPLEAILAPLFFVLIGIQVKLESFTNGRVLWIAIGLIIAAIIGKLLSGLGSSRKADRLLVGIGMLPRGEVGLIFASIGRVIGVINDELFSAIILMVIVTTLVAPIWLKKRYEAKRLKINA